MQLELKLFKLVIFTDFAACLARLAFWLKEDIPDFEDVQQLIHADLFKEAADSVIQTARKFNREQIGVASAEESASRRSPEELAAEYNRAADRRVLHVPWNPELSQVEVFPDDVRAVVHREKFILEEEMRVNRFQGDPTRCGELHDSVLYSVLYSGVGLGSIASMRVH